MRRVVVCLHEGEVDECGRCEVCGVPVRMGPIVGVDAEVVPWWTHKAYIYARERGRRHLIYEAHHRKTVLCQWYRDLTAAIDLERQVLGETDDVKAMERERQTVLDDIHAL